MRTGNTNVTDGIVCELHNLLLDNSHFITEVRVNSKEAVFLLIKESLFSEAQALSYQTSDWDWNSIYNELCDHSIACLPYRFLKKGVIPNEKLFADWKNSCFLQFRHWIQAMYGELILRKQQIC